MKSIWFLAALIFLSLPAFAGTKYEGNVGKLAAVFDITFKSDEIVSGKYSYPKRPGVTYSLIGHNREAGKLYLEEFTGGRLSARCHLEKRITDTHIIWEGEMRNIDGEVFPMLMKRERGRMTTKSEVKAPDYFSRIPREIRWPEPPKADIAVSMATAHYGKGYANAEVVDCKSDNSSTTIAFTLGVFVEKDLRHVFEHTGPTVSLTFPRPLPQKGKWLEGNLIELEVTSEGEILALNLAQIAVTHYRKSKSKKLEIRGLIERPGINHGESFKEFEKFATKIEFIPDKIALPGQMSSAESTFLGFQTLRVTKEFGMAVQVLDAGPGALELESISLDEPGGELPWIPIGTGNPRESAPLSQRTREGG